MDHRLSHRQGAPSNNRSVLTNICHSKVSSTMKTVNLVLDSKMMLPVNVKSFKKSIRTSSPKIEEENMFGLEEVNLSFDTNRKRKLDHLTLEEKLKRKKLKNRVAAQTSRDRKKARMDELEFEVKRLLQENHLLVQQNTTLMLENEKLTSENELLQKKLTNKKTDALEAEPVNVSCRPITGPAVSVSNPQPQGIGLQLALGLCKENTLMKILTFCILSQISLPNMGNQNTISTNLESLQQVCFKRLMKINKKFLHQVSLLLTDYAMNTSPIKWWGHQQKTWNPMEKQPPVQT